MEDRQARFEDLYETCSPDIAMYALRRSDRETAQDIVAETFTIAWRRFDDVPREPLPWLYGVARRVLANQRRSARRLTVLRQKLAPNPDNAPELADPELGAAFRELPEIDREILALVAWEGLRPSEAAVVLECTSTAARLRLHRARNRLASALGLPTSDVVPQQVVEEVS